MTEQAYIDTRDLSSVHHAIMMLGDITLKNQPVIPADEYLEVMRKLDSWRDKLFSAVHYHLGIVDGEPTLDAFIADRIMPTGQRTYLSNIYVSEPGFKSLYVRLIPHWFDGASRLTLDLANIEVEKPGTGTFTRLVERLRRQYPALTLRVEVVQSPRFGKKLETMGFKSDGIGSFVLLPV